MKTRVIYNPQPDITTYELAQLIKLLIPATYKARVKVLNDFPPECHRHLTPIE